jgi:hypothetical protein
VSYLKLIVACTNKEANEDETGRSICLLYGSNRSIVLNVALGLFLLILDFTGLIVIFMINYKAIKSNSMVFLLVISLK